MAKQKSKIKEIQNTQAIAYLQNARALIDDLQRLDALYCVLMQDAPVLIGETELDPRTISLIGGECREAAIKQTIQKIECELKEFTDYLPF